MNKCDKRCIDCIHFDMCADLHAYYKGVDKEWVIAFMSDGHSDKLECGHFKDKSLCVELPCKVGDNVEFGEEGFLAEVQGFVYNPIDLGWRYKLDFCTPTFDFYGIKRIIPKEEAEKKLKEIEK